MNLTAAIGVRRLSAGRWADTELRVARPRLPNRRPCAPADSSHAKEDSL
jgi:hypothetical protein